MDLTGGKRLDIELDRAKTAAVTTTQGRLVRAVQVPTAMTTMAHPTMNAISGICR
jgi:hypothetical protein